MSSGRISKITPQGDEGFQARDTKFIQILNFDFFYGPKQALFDINLDIPEREIAAFIGPSARNMPDDFRVSMTNTPGEKAYPISSFTWLLISEKLTDQTKLEVIKDFLQWMSTDGQKLTQELLYAPLPEEVVAKEQAAFSKIQ